MAGYSGKPLAEKLGVKPGLRVALINAPQSVASEVLQPDVVLIDIGKDDADIVLLFATEAAYLADAFRSEMARTAQAGMIWVAWPKKASKAATDLDENVVRDTGIAAGMVDVKVCAIDEYWSGLKFVRRLRDRK